MTNPTTPFNWQMPTASDLVTDLPADFETFGQAVATSMADLLGGTTGQVLSKASNTDMDFTWVTSDDANAIQNTIVDAKGDLIAATASDTPARLAVGNNGETLVADSSASTGLRYQGNFAAGKNAILNADFKIWQRGTSFSANNSSNYCADRFAYDDLGIATISQQTFTSGTAPVAGYEGQFFVRFAQTGAGAAFMFQRIEDVRQFAGQTVTVSVWAKAGASLSLAGQVRQNFGTGGSANVNTTLSTQTVTTSWARYSWTISVPSLTGSTIGTGSYLQIRLDLPSSGTFTFDTWGWQVEAGSVATAFQTATGTLQGELAACQRYYQVIGGTSSQFPLLGGYSTSTTTNIRYPITFPVTMRIAPTGTKNGTWATSNCNQPIVEFVGAYGFTLTTTSTANAVNWYLHPDSTDDTITLSAEL
jgi:hypothetical protein